LPTIDKNNILVFDDLVPDYLMDQMDSSIPHMPLRFGHRGLGHDEGYTTFSEQWTREVQQGATVEHTNFLVDMPWEFKTFWCVVNSFRDTLFKNIHQGLQLNQVQVNLTTKEHVGGLHTDAPDDTAQLEMPGWLPSHTLVYFMEGDSGLDFCEYDSVNFEVKTVEHIEWKKGRCVVFPSSYPHKGLAPINVSPRITVGFIFNGLPLQRQEDKQ
tara:strand:- start:707 stop:1345 length:639 start_codon:yes stop_codon:yes gene_type:complete